MNIFYEADLPTRNYSDDFEFGDIPIKKLLSGLLMLVSLVCLLFVVVRTIKSLKARS